MKESLNADLLTLTERVIKTDFVTAPGNYYYVLLPGFTRILRYAWAEDQLIAVREIIEF